MTLNELKDMVADEFGSDFGGDKFNVADFVADLVRAEIKKHRSSWQVANVWFGIAGQTKSKAIAYGWRKNTTGEYVPNSYRSNFGWKNTYYQNASIDITVSRQQVIDARNEAFAN